MVNWLAFSTEVYGHFGTDTIIELVRPAKCWNCAEISQLNVIGETEWLVPPYSVYTLLDKSTNSNSPKNTIEGFKFKTYIKLEVAFDNKAYGDIW